MMVQKYLKETSSEPSILPTTPGNLCTKRDVWMPPIGTPRIRNGGCFQKARARRHLCETLSKQWVGQEGWSPMDLPSIGTVSNEASPMGIPVRQLPWDPPACSGVGGPAGLPLFWASSGRQRAFSGRAQISWRLLSSSWIELSECCRQLFKCVELFNNCTYRVAKKVWQIVWHHVLAHVLLRFKTPLLEKGWNTIKGW